MAIHSDEDITSASATKTPASQARSVIFLGPTLDSLGGGEVWLNRMANEMARRGWAVTAIGRAAPRVPVEMRWHPDVRRFFLDQRPEPRVLPSSGVRELAKSTVDFITRGWRPRGWFQDRLDRKSQVRLDELLEADHRRSVIVCADLYTAVMVSELSSTLRRRYPYVVIHHNSFASLSMGSRSELRRSSKAGSRFIALTPEDARLFTKAGFAKVMTIFNPIEWPAEHKMDKPKTTKVVWMGRMSRAKSVDLLLRAWPRVSSTHPDWTLSLFGDGDLRDELVALTQELGIQDSVHFAGVTREPQEAFADAKIHVLTSKFEGWALVVGEAGSFDVPTISTDSGPGIRLQVQDGKTGVLLKSRSKKKLANAICRLIEDEELRATLGSNAKEFQTRFSLSSVGDEWEKTLQEVLEEVY